MKNRNLKEEVQKSIIYIDESYFHHSYMVKKILAVQTAYLYLVKIIFLVIIYSL